MVISYKALNSLGPEYLKNFSVDLLAKLVSSVGRKTRNITSNQEANENYITDAIPKI